MVVSGKIEVNNQLENLLSGLPGEVQSIVRPLADPFIEVIEMVSGDPDDLTRAAEVWRDAATHVRETTAQQKSAVDRTRQRWKGEASDAFGAKLEEVGTTLDAVAKNLDETSGLLVQAAQGCAEAANLILDILVDLLMFLIADLLISLALAVVSAGASMAAGAATAAANAARAFSQVMKIVEKLAKLMDRLHDLMKQLKRGLEAYKRGFEELKAMKKSTSLFSREGLLARGGKSAYTAPARIPLGQALGEPVPGGAAGLGMNIGKDVYKYAESSSGEINPQPNQGQ